MWWGRDNEIARYWGVLERQGLVISAERRIGKTHIVLKMRDECRSGFLPFYQDLRVRSLDPRSSFVPSTARFTSP